jgi:predicted alpha/beta superfamily hydrolase
MENAFASDIVAVLSRKSSFAVAPRSAMSRPTVLNAIAITWTLWTFQAILVAQPQSEVTFAPVVKGLVLEDVERSEFHSRFTGQDYSVYISLPVNYSQDNQRYPVLFVPDYDGAFLAVREANYVMRVGNMLEEFILVGVPLKSNGVEELLRKRVFDFTPTEVKEMNTSYGKQWHGEVRSGGAPLFLRTLKEELIPFIESRYRVTSDRGLVGYSLGGLFAAYVLLNDANTFSRYLIGSPSLWWDKGMILKTEATLAASRKSLHGRVFLSVGAEEGGDMVGPLRNLTTAFASHAYPDLRVESHIFESTDHLSGVLGTFSRGLKVLYPRQQPKQ